MEPFKKVCLMMFIALTASSAAASETAWKGYLVDRMCADGAKTPAKVKQLCETHTKECALDPKCVSSGYTIYSGSKTYIFDDKGNKQAKKLIEASKREDGGMPVEVKGALSGNTIAVSEIKEVNSP